MRHPVAGLNFIECRKRLHAFERIKALRRAKEDLTGLGITRKRQHSPRHHRISPANGPRTRMGAPWSRATPQRPSRSLARSSSPGISVTIRMRLAQACAE